MRHAEHPRRSRLAQILLITSWLPLTVPPAWAAVTAEFQPDALVVGGVSAGQSVVVLGVARQPIAFGVRVLRRLETLVDEDGDGQVRLPLGDELLGASVWWVVDLASGERVAVAPAPHPVRPFISDEEGAEIRAVLSPELLLPNRSRFELVLVRPTVGVWGISAAEGGVADADDNPNGELHVSVLELPPLADGQPALSGLQPNDVLLGIDPGSLEVLSLTASTEGAAGGAR